jgi:hypothetical protein
MASKTGENGDQRDGRDPAAKRGTVPPENERIFPPLRHTLASAAAHRVMRFQSSVRAASAKQGCGRPPPPDITCCAQHPAEGKDTPAAGESNFQLHGQNQSKEESALTPHITRLRVGKVHHNKMCFRQQTNFEK